MAMQGVETRNGHGAHVPQDALTQEASHISMSAGDAINIFNDMKDQLDLALIGEEAAKLALIGALTKQQPVGLGGSAGGGKSTGIRAACRLVEGIDYYNPKVVTFIPGEHDLTAKQIIGGKVEKKIKVDGSERKEVIELPPKFHPTTVMAHYEEMTGTNPFALRASMSVIERKVLETDSGIVRLPRFMTAFCSMNPTNAQDGTFDIPDQVASRMRFGAIMGLPLPREAQLAHDKAVRHMKEHPEEDVVPVVSVPRLIALGNYLAHTAIDQATDEKLGEIAYDLANYLRETHDLDETNNRVNKHLQETARVFGGLRNRNHAVEPEDLVDAARTVISARICSKPSSKKVDLEADVLSITNL